MGLRPPEPLEGRFVTVEPLEPRHGPALLAAARAEPDLFRYLVQVPDEAWLDRALAAEDEIPFAIVSGGVPIGSTRYLTIRPEHRGVEIGWSWVASSAHRQGANAETKLLLLEHAFERWGAMRVEFKTDATNLRARGALEALPARFEGVHRKHMILPSHVRDSAYYAIVDDDWPGVKANLERRLAELAA